MDLFVVGEVVKTRGLRGCVKVLSHLESGDILQNIHFLYLGNASGQEKRYEINKISPAGRHFFLELKGISDIDAAQKLVGAMVLLPRDHLGPLDEGEYYWQDIIGLDVYTLQGRHLGRVAAILPTGANDVYVCRGEGTEVLIPAIAEVIEDIDLSLRKITVKLPEELTS
jgi:16S rRNA processing protein RimM